jgi:hypothetical protein
MLKILGDWREVSTQYLAALNVSLHQPKRRPPFLRSAACLVIPSTVLYSSAVRSGKTACSYLACSRDEHYTGTFCELGRPGRCPADCTYLVNVALPANGAPHLFLRAFNLSVVVYSGARHEAPQLGPDKREMRSLKRVFWILIAILGAVALGMIATVRGGLLCAASLAAVPQRAARVVEIRVVGSERFSQAEVVKASGLKLGAEANADSFKEAANNLAATGVFASVRYRYTPTSAGIAIEFQVTDASKFVSCRFDNFVWFSDEELKKELRSRVPLFTGDVPLAGKLQDQVATALQSILKERGIPGTIRQEGASNHVGGPVEAILFSVEGASIHIGQVKFQGVNQVEVAGLDAAMKPLFGTEYQQSFVSDFARLNLGPIYIQQGFLRVEFGMPIAELVKDDLSQHSVTVTIPVREGLQYRLAGLQFSGNSVISSADLIKNIHLLPGKPANGVQLQLDLGNIHDLYGTRGYLTARVMPHPAFADDQKTVSYDLQVHEGDLYRMGKLEIVGLDPARAEAFKKKCMLAEGDPYDTSYWKKFLAQAGPFLPRVAGRWNVTFGQSRNSTTKTVDVTIGYKLTPSTNP